VRGWWATRTRWNLVIRRRCRVVRVTRAHKFRGLDLLERENDEGDRREVHKLERQEVSALNGARAGNGFHADR